MQTDNSHTPIIELEDICFHYTEDRPILNGMNFHFHAGERVGLMAPNGSGKTTLFHIIMGLLKPISGQLRVFGRPMSDEKGFESVRRRIGLLFQDSDDQLFSPTVLEDVAFGPLNLGKGKTESIEIAEKTLASLGLSGYRDRITFKLSGGEKRLVSLATVLAMEPEVLLLDEPTTGLDVDTRERIISILGHLDISYIMISHNLDFLSQLTQVIYTVTDGKINSDETIHAHQHVHAHSHGTYPHEHK
jgi:cobalt/nickel transport system ATP-binding protein